MNNDWQMREAKAKLSALIAAPQNVLQAIIRRGEPIVVVLPVTMYERLSMREDRETLFDFFRAWPDFKLPERDKSALGRDVH